MAKGRNKNHKYWREKIPYIITRDSPCYFCHLDGCENGICTAFEYWYNSQ